MDVGGGTDVPQAASNTKQTREIRQHRMTENTALLVKANSPASYLPVIMPPIQDSAKNFATFDMTSG